MRDPNNLTKAELHQAWRLVTWAGVLGSSYYLICVNGAPRVRFLTEMNATASDFGLISGLGSFVIIFQILGSMLTNHMRHRKPVWMTLVILHRLMFLGVLAAPMLFLGDRMRIGWVILFLFLHDALAQMTGPMFMSWMADLLPRQSLNRHWATRQRFITITNIFAMVALAFGFGYFEDRGLVIEGFSIIAAGGVVLGVIDILMFTFVPEPTAERVERAPLRDIVLQPLKDKAFRPFLVYGAFWTFAVSLSAPFFALYMIDKLELRVLTVQLMGIGGAVGVVVSSRFWGLLCDTYGYRPTMQFLCLAKVVTPLAFFFVPREPALAIPYLTAFMVYDGVMNSGLMLANQGILLTLTPRRNRTMYIAASSFFSVGIMATLGPIMAGYLIDYLEPRVDLQWGVIVFTGFHGAFAISALLRMGGFFLISRLQEPTAVSLPEVIRQVSSVKSFRVARQVYRLTESPDPAGRLAAANRLAVLRHPMAIGELINALTDESSDVREAAAHALGEIGVSDAVEPLSKALFDPESGIQHRAALALGKIGGVDSLKALLENLRHRNSKALGETIDALAHLNHDAAYLPLIGLFHEVKDEELRTRIATALGRMSKTEALAEVLDLLNARRPPGPSPIR